MTAGEPIDPALRFHLAEELGVLAGRIHNAGVEHRDLHERNIIVRPAAGGGLELFMLDLHELIAPARRRVAMGGARPGPHGAVLHIANDRR